MSARIDRTEQKTKDCYRNRISDDVRDEPCEELEGDCPKYQSNHEKALADAWSKMCENKTS